MLQDATFDAEQTQFAMILTYTVTDTSLNTDVNVPVKGFDSDGLVLDTAGKHTIVFKSNQQGVSDIVWNWATEELRDDALGNIQDAMADPTPLYACTVDANGTVVPTPSS